ncbi:MAG: ABC transporter substrate-binding protein [Polyangiales bacterium]
MSRSPSKSNTPLAPWVLALCCLALVGCGRDRASASGASGEPAAKGEPLALRYQGSAGIVTYPELAEDLGYLAPLKLQHVGNTISGPQDVQTVVTGDTDFGGAFNGAVLKLVASKAPIRAVIGLAGIDAETWYGFYVRDDSPIRGPRDLIGKKVGMNTLGAHHEFVLKEYLARGGLTKDEIAQVTLVALPPVNTEQSLRARQLEVGVLGHIHRDKALERGGLRKLFSDYDLFGPMTSASYVVHERFAREHPEAVKRFVEATARAIEWAKVTPREEVVARMRAIVAKRGRNENGDLLAYFRPVIGETRGGALSDLQFQRWIDWLVRAGELKPGAIKVHDAYTNRFHPFAADAEKQP